MTNQISLQLCITVQENIPTKEWLLIVVYVGGTVGGATAAFSLAVVLSFKVKCLASFPTKSHNIMKEGN